jgi:hypothetical protein
MIESLAFIGCFILGCLAIFQAVLICGAPIGKFAWGGAHAVLPAALRAGSAIAIVLYTIFAIVLLDRAEVINVLGSRISEIGIWIIFVYFCVGIVMNAISLSKSERLLMTPTAFALAVIYLLVARS